MARGRAGQGSAAQDRAEAAVGCSDEGVKRVLEGFSGGSMMGAVV